MHEHCAAISGPGADSGLWVGVAQPAGGNAAGGVPVTRREAWLSAGAIFVLAIVVRAIATGYVAVHEHRAAISGPGADSGLRVEVAQPAGGNAAGGPPMTRREAGTRPAAFP